MCPVDGHALIDPPMKVHALTTCPACGSARLAAFELAPGRELQRCADCGTVSATRYADPSEIYREGYLFGEVEGFGIDVRDETFQRYLRRVAARRVAMIERATAIRQGRLLDVGSGTGEVLTAARDRGWHAQGVEPEATSAGLARERGLDVVVSELEASGLPERSYDVVSAFHVLEHVPDSRAFLRTLARWARPGGFVAVEVPNWKGVLRRRLRGDWPMLRPLEHLVHFAPDTLQRTLRASGLTPIAVRSPVYLGPPQTLQHALDDLVRHGRYRRLVEPLSRVRGGPGAGSGERFPTRGGWAVLRATEAIYDRAGVGAVVFCVAAV